MRVNDARRKQEQLRVELDDAEAEEILAHAIADVPGFYTPDEVAVADRRALIGAASLAIGDAQFTRRLLEQLGGEDLLLTAARHYLWTGDDVTMREQLPRIVAKLPDVTPFAELQELALALESVGAADEATGVRARLAQSQRRLLADPEAYDCNVLPAANAADTVVTFVHAILGAAPDAPRGRLRLRTRLPDWIDRMAVHNLRLGDALIELTYEVVGKTIAYGIEQVAGAIPVRLIFEPTFSAPVARAQVDHVPADLAVQPLGTRVIAPVQLMLDHERRVVFEID